MYEREDCTIYFILQHQIINSDYILIAYVRLNKMPIIYLLMKDQVLHTISVQINKCINPLGDVLQS